MSLKIMIVDDEPANLQLLRTIAAPLYHTLFAFQDPQEAMQRADVQRFDVVFLNLGTPAQRGLELAQYIRSSSSNGEAAIIMLGSADDIVVVRTAFGQGADFVLPQPLTVARVRPMLAAMDSPGWKGKRHTARLPLFTDVHCTRGERKLSLRSLNISESGMLLQPATDLDQGQEVSLEFTIAEVSALLHVSARVVRKEGDQRVGVAFVNLAPEHRNSIQLYVMGRLRPPAAPREMTFGRAPSGS
jgi:CheY-like chemotaxis protein